MLDRAQKLVSGLADEKVRWEETVKVCLLLAFNLQFYCCCTFVVLVVHSSTVFNDRVLDIDKESN